MSPYLCVTTLIPALRGGDNPKKIATQKIYKIILCKGGGSKTDTDHWMVFYNDSEVPEFKRGYSRRS